MSGSSACTWDEIQGVLALDNAFNRAGLDHVLLVRVALANKMARIVWALMARGGIYQSPTAAA